MVALGPNTWQHRVDRAASLNFSSDFDQEMAGFAQFLEVAPAEETLATMWPLLQNTLPYVAPSGFHHEVWEAFEKFIARQLSWIPFALLNSIHKCMNARNRRCGTVKTKNDAFYLYVPQI